MPNWCQNSVVMQHDNPEMIRRAVDALADGNLFMEFIKPPPDYTYQDGWYEWNVENWGTKWDVGDDDSVSSDYKEGDTEISLYFDSAWTPPIEGFRNLEKLGFNIQAYFFEEGCQFCGKYIEGEEFCYQIDGDSEWVRANIPSDIDEEFDISGNMEMWEEELSDEDEDEDSN